MGDIESGKALFRALIISVTRNHRYDPRQLVLRWDPPEPILNEHQISMPNRSHILTIYKGTQAVVINVFQSDIEAAVPSPNTILRYEREVTEALAKLCGPKACREEDHEVVSGPAG